MGAIRNMTDYAPLPPDIVNYLTSGTGKGQRNDMLFKAAVQMRDAGWPQNLIEDTLERRGAADGLPPREALATIKSVFTRGSREPIKHGRRVEHYTVKPPPEEKPTTAKVYTLDESEGLPEPMENGGIEFLTALFQPDDNVMMAVARLTEEGGESPTGSQPVLKRDKWIEKIEEKGDASAIWQHSKDGEVVNHGLYVAINPLRIGKAGRRIGNVGLMHALIEFDTISQTQQWQLIKHSKIPCATVVDSGNKSIHALVRVDASSLDEYTERTQILLDHFEKYDVDIQNKDPTRLSRFPDAIRGDTGRRQRLLAVNIGATTFEEWYEGVKDDYPPILSESELDEQDLHEPPEIIEGLLHRRLSLVLGGGSKAYKSWTLLDMAVCIANGQPFWGFNTVEGKVLYINFEIPDYFFRERKDLVAKARGLFKASENLFIWNLRGMAQGFELIKPKMESVMVNQNFSAVILDPIYKTLGNRDENAAGDIADLFNQLENLALEVGSAVVFAAHFSKGPQAAKNPMDRISGSGVYARSPDTLLLMTEHEDDGCYTVDCTARNHKSPAPFVVSLDFPIFKRVSGKSPEALKGAVGRPKMDTLSDMLDVVERHTDTDTGFACQTEVIDSLVGMGYKKGTLRRHIGEAVEKDVLEREERAGKSSLLKRTKKHVFGG